MQSYEESHDEVNEESVNSGGKMESETSYDI